MADEEGLAEIVETVGVRHQRDVVLVRLPKANAGVEADARSLDAGREESVAALAEVVVNLGDDVGVGGIVLHRLRRPLHVHGTDAGLSFASDGRSSAGSPVRPVTSLMISAPAAMAARATAALEVSMERMASGRSTVEGFDDRNDAAQFLVGINGSGIGASAFAADIENGGSFSPSNFSPCSIAASRPKNLPPSEKLSGVTFTIPISSGSGPNVEPLGAELPACYFRK